MSETEHSQVECDRKTRGLPCRRAKATDADACWYHLALDKDSAFARLRLQAEDIIGAARLLVKYDAIGQDLSVKFSDTLRSRQIDLERKIRALLGSVSFEQARGLIEKAQPVPEPKTSKKKSRKRRKGKKGENPNYRGQDDSGHTAESHGRTQPERITSIVSGGLPASSRRH